MVVCDRNSVVQFKVSEHIKKKYSAVDVDRKYITVNLDQEIVHRFTTDRSDGSQMSRDISQIP